MGRARSTDAEDAGAPPDAGSERVRPVSALRLRLILIAVVAIGAMMLIIADWDSPVRVAITLAFFLFVPGLALAELLRIDDPVNRLAIATSASLAIETLVALALIYAGLFSAEAASAVVVGLTLAVLVAAALTREGRMPGKTPDAPSRRAAT